MKQEGVYLVVGAGPCGLTMAGLLARRGHSVVVLEKLASPDHAARSNDERAINLSLSPRGLSVLAKLGLEKQIRNASLPTPGRMVHLPSGQQVWQPYGLGKEGSLLTVAREELHRILRNGLSQFPNVEICYGSEVVAIDKSSGSVTYREQGREARLTPTLTVGTDGAFSKVRQLMHRGEYASYRQTFFGWSYKQVNICSAFDPNGVHIWPAKDALIVALPNSRGGFTANLFLERSSATSFQALQGAQDMTAFLADRFPDLASVASKMASQLERNPENHIVETSTDRWHVGDKFVLAGDSCHAMYHFYAQGLNTGLEDCDELDRRLAHHARAEALSRYQQSRKPSADSISELSRANFTTLKDRVASPLYHARLVTELWLNQVLGKFWLPTYRLISDSGFSQSRVRRRLALRRWTFTLAGLPLLVGSMAIFVTMSRVLQALRSKELPPPCLPEQEASPLKKHFAFKSLCLIFGASLLMGAAPSQRTVRVGLASTLSDIGTNSSIPHGDFFRRGIQLAIKHSAKTLRAAGIRIELKDYDYGNDRLKVMEVAKSTVASDVAAVIGYNFSDHAILAAPIHQKGKLAFITPTATADRVSELGEFVHPLSFNNAFQARLLAVIARKEMKAKKVFAVVAQDCTYCQDFAAGFAKSFGELGGEVVTLPVLKDDTNFTGVVQEYQKRGGKSELIFIPNHEVVSAAIIQAFLNAKIKAPFLGGDGWANYGTRIFESMFQERTFTALAITHWDKQMVNRFTAKFLSDYEAANDQAPNMTAAMAYDSMLFLIEALKTCPALDRVAIEACLSKQTTFEGVTGSYRFPKPNAAPEKSLVILKRKNRRFEFLKVVSP